ncbi:PHP domain-containing protein [Candidatus Woesearchaeota archaeon]|nr:PHP domain-containing protein [Candidatus Woesearchaeota archaeon]
MKNQLVASILNGIADILEFQNVAFKPQAYRTAALTISSLSENIEDLIEKGMLREVQGIGEHIAVKIEEIVETGKLKYYEELKKEVPVEIPALRQIPGLGPKKIKVLYEKLKVRTVADLKKVLEQNKVAGLEGFGVKTQAALLAGIGLIETRVKRHLYAEVEPVVAYLISELKKERSVLKVEPAGSFARGKETIGDIDLLAISAKPKEVMRTFISLRHVKEVLVHGPTKSSVRLDNGIQVDLRVVSEKEYGAASMYFIGSKEHNIELRKLALKKGYTLNEYSLSTVKGEKWVAGRTQEEIYGKLGMSFIEPELRESKGEIDAAKEGRLPKLVEEREVLGAFHNHSTYSDGSASLLEMAQKAESLGWKFISFNDHYGPVGITNPLNPKRVAGYLAEIEKVRKKVGLRVFSGLEIDILKDGTLPLSKKELENFDVVIASVHLALGMEEKEMTTRVCRTLNEYPVTMLGHPTGRLLNTREPMELNKERVFETCRDRDVFLEINGSPSRMDLNGDHVKFARDLGCQFALSTDGHAPSHLTFLPHAVRMARRGWLEKKDVLNCWGLKEIEKKLRS